MSDRFAWTRPLDAFIRGATSRFPLLAAVTPKNAAAEQARLATSWARGQEASPRWVPPDIDRVLLLTTRSAIDRAIESLSGDDPWRALYRGRLAELSADLGVVEAAFGPELPAAADLRFGGDAREDVDAAEALARGWISTEASEDDQELVLTDDPNDPRSLFSRMRATLSALRLPVRVVVRDRVGALAAAGDGVVIVAAGRRITPRETERVVLHEVEGHVLPRERGRAHEPPLCTLGSARSSEDEEGRALLLEERASVLGASRKRTLAARDRAARLVVRGATFVDVVRSLRDVGLSVEDALAIAARTMRGARQNGRDVVGGLARERVYLPAYARIRRAAESDPKLLDRLGSRRLSLAAWALLV